MTQLPPEIVDHIIDHLHDSPPDLRVCACVCKGWLESARFHLFYSISIVPRNQSYPSCHRLYEALQHSPRIAFHVRQLTFSTNEGGMGLLMTEFSDWPTLKRVLPLLLQSFTRLSRLKLVDITWASLTPIIRKTIRNLLALPSLVRFEMFLLKISKLEHLTTLFRPHLKRLHVFFYLYDESTHEPEVDKENEQYAVMEQPCRLDHLTFFTGHGFVDWLVGPQSTIDISNLHTLEMMDDERGLRNLMSLVRISGRSLKHIEVMFNRIRYLGWLIFLFFSRFSYLFADTIPTEDPARHRIDFADTPNLKTLSLSMYFCRKNALGAACLLSNLAAPSLREIALKFQFSYIHLVGSDVEWSWWAELDQIFDTRPFSLLHKLNVFLCVPHSYARPGDMESLRQKFVKHFPCLNSREITKLEDLFI
jgi:hypothetical protein